MLKINPFENGEVKEFNGLKLHLGLIITETNGLTVLRK